MLMPKKSKVTLNHSDSLEGILNAILHRLYSLPYCQKCRVCLKFCHASVISSSPELISTVGNSPASMSWGSSSVAKPEADRMSDCANFFCDEDALFLFGIVV